MNVKETIALFKAKQLALDNELKAIVQDPSIPLEDRFQLLDDSDMTPFHYMRMESDDMDCLEELDHDIDVQVQRWWGEAEETNQYVCFAGLVLLLFKLGQAQTANDLKAECCAKFIKGFINTW